MRVDLPSGPIREIKLDEVHERCIGPLLEKAATRLDLSTYGRCLCLDCRPGQIVVKAWHLWAGFR